MGTSRRHKNLRKQDFAKRKLKVGKTPLKRDNYTDTSFKARSVTLNQKKTLNSQITESEALKKKLSILRKPTQNKNARKAILTELHDQITEDYDSLASHMDDILKVSAILIIDRSRKIREMNLDLWKALIEKGKTDVFVLHLDPLLLFINSGMTHLAPGIQMDSLKYLDCLLSNSELSPLVVKSYWFKLLKNFMILMNWVHSSDTNGNGKNLIVRETSTELMSKNLSKNRIEELRVLSRLIHVGCIPEKVSVPKEVEVLANAPQIHPYTNLYMMSPRPDPFSALKLFRDIQFHSSTSTISGIKSNGEEANYEQLPTEDLENRSKILCEVFGDGLKEGLNELKKDDNRELANKAISLMNDYGSIHHNYLEANGMA